MPSPSDILYRPIHYIRPWLSFNSLCQHILYGPTINERGEPIVNQLRLRNHRLKFKTTGELPIDLDESIEYTLK